MAKSHHFIGSLTISTALLFATVHPTAHAANVLWSNQNPTKKQTTKPTSNVIQPTTKPATWSYDTQHFPYYLPNTNHEVFYNINPNQSQTNQTLWRQAMQAWSNLGVLKLTEVPWGDNRAIIHAYTYTDYISMNDLENYDTDTDDYANTDTTTTDTNGVAKIEVANVKFYPEFRSVTNYQQKLAIAEHEVGHALGFAHDKQWIVNPITHKFTPVLMTPGEVSKNSHPGLLEQTALQAHYQ